VKLTSWWKRSGRRGIAKASSSHVEDVQEIVPGEPAQVHKLVLGDEAVDLVLEGG
jgi:hypothetical protein